MDCAAWVATSCGCVEARRAVCELKDARPHLSGRHAPRNVARTVKVPSLVVREEKCLVFPNRTADAPAIAIVLQQRVRLAKAVAGPRVGVEMVVLQIFVRGSVELVSTAPRDHLHLSARRARKTCARVRGHNAELLNALDRCRHNRAWRGREVCSTVLAAARGAVAGVA